MKNKNILFVVPGFILLIGFFFAPSLYNIWIGFFDLNLFKFAQGGKFVGLSNFKRMFENPEILRVFFNTIFWLTFVTVVLRIVLGLVIGLLMNSEFLKRWRLTTFVRFCLLLPWVTPPVVAVAAWKWILHPRYGALTNLLLKLGILKEGISFFVQTDVVWIGIILIIIWQELPFVAISILAGLQSIPLELYESSKVEGASSFQSFRYITLPLLRPVISVIGLLITIWTFNNFMFVWTASRGGPGTFTQVLATELYTQAFVNYKLSYGAAIGVVMTLIMVFFSVIYFKTIFEKSIDGE